MSKRRQALNLLAMGEKRSRVATVCGLSYQSVRNIESSMDGGYESVIGDPGVKGDTDDYSLSFERQSIGLQEEQPPRYAS